MKRTVCIAVLAALAPLAVASPASAGSLLAPAKGAVVSAPPLLRWRAAAGATHYNVQLFFGARKVLSAWPERPRLRLRSTWMYGGHARRLRPGRYYWFVWPGFGSHYGTRLGKRNFIWPSRPRNVRPPSAVGVAREGVPLRVVPGRWTGTPPLLFSYGWFRCDSAGAGCVPLIGAGGPAYAPGAADIDATLRVVVHTRNKGGRSSAMSPATPAVAAAPPRNVAPPRIWGRPQIGSLLTVANGSWTSSRPVGYSFRWLRCDVAGRRCAAIPGANEQAYALQRSDLVHGIRAVVRARNVGGSRRARSASSAAVGSLIRGGAANDAIRGTRGADVIAGLQGNDTLLGWSGPDRLNGGPGIDRLLAGLGNDIVFTRDGRRDLVNCGRGRDRLYADRLDRAVRCERVIRR